MALWSNWTWGQKNHRGVVFTKIHDKKKPRFFVVHSPYKRLMEIEKMKHAKNWKLKKGRKIGSMKGPLN
jgi:hypothetical protein